MHYTHAIPVAGETVNDLNARLAADYDPAADDASLFGREHTFSNGWKMRVEVVGRRSSSPVIVATLYDDEGRQAGRELGMPGGIDQAYTFRMPQGDEYTLTIERGAYAHLDEERVEAFCKDAKRCPHCAGDQIDNDSLVLVDNAKVTTVFLCLDCKAEFRVTYVADAIQPVKFPETGPPDA